MVLIRNKEDSALFTAFMTLSSVELGEILDGATAKQIGI